MFLFHSQSTSQSAGWAHWGVEVMFVDKILPSSVMFESELKPPLKMSGSVPYNGTARTPLAEDWMVFILICRVVPSRGTLHLRGKLRLWTELLILSMI